MSPSTLLSTLLKKKYKLSVNVLIVNTINTHAEVLNLKNYTNFSYFISVPIYASFYTMKIICFSGTTYRKKSAKLNSKYRNEIIKPNTISNNILFLFFCPWFMPAADDEFNLSYSSHIHMCLYTLIHHYTEKP